MPEPAQGLLGILASERRALTDPLCLRWTLTRKRPRLLKAEAILRLSAPFRALLPRDGEGPPPSIKAYLPPTRSHFPFLHFLPTGYLEYLLNSEMLHLWVHPNIPFLAPPIPLLRLAIHSPFLSFLAKSSHIYTSPTFWSPWIIFDDSSKIK